MGVREFSMFGSLARGEAAAHIPDEVARRWPDVPWRMMRDMRNLVIHEYFGVNPDIQWGTVIDDLPLVVSELRRIVGSGGADSR